MNIIFGGYVMRKISLIMSSILLFCLLFLCFYIRYGGRTAAVMDIPAAQYENASTKEWQDAAAVFLNKRNNIINDVLNKKINNVRKCIADLKTFECSPLLDGDAALIEYMLKHPERFNSRSGNIKLECTEIVQLTKDEVILHSKMDCIRNDMPWRYDYRIVFRRINGEWKISGIYDGQ